MTAFLSHCQFCLLSSTVNPRPLFSFTRSCKWHWSPRLEQVYICVWYIHLSVIYIICMTSLWDMVIRFISLVCILSWEIYLSHSFWIILKKWFHWLEFKILCVQIVYPLLPLLHPAESTNTWMIVKGRLSEDPESWQASTWEGLGKCKGVKVSLNHG